MCPVDINDGLVKSQRHQLLEKIGCSEHRVLKGTRVSNGLMTPKSDCILHPVDFLRIWFLPIVKRERIFQSNDYFIRPPSRDYLISSQVFLYFLNKGQERFLENQSIRLRAYIRRLCQRSSCLSASMEFAPPLLNEITVSSTFVKNRVWGGWSDRLVHLFYSWQYG